MNHKYNQSTLSEDNILVHSKKADQHQDDLTKFLDRCLEEGITLKRARTAHCKKEVLYVYGGDGSTSGSS